MALLGIPLLVVLACAAVLAPVATLLLWSRVRGPRPVRGGLRLGMLWTGQLATVLLVAALANDYGQFYTSWADLFGTAGGHPTVATYGAPLNGGRHGHPGVAALPDRAGRPHHPHQRPQARPTPSTPPQPVTGHLRVLGPNSWSTRAQWHTRGKVESVRITGLRSGLSVHAFVYLPPQYFSPQYAHHQFPAVEVLTGYPGSALNLVSRMNYPQIALTDVRQHRSVPMVYVMLSSTVAPPRDTECTDVPGGPQAETFLASELPSAVQAALRVQPGHWGIVGDSTGGYCAAKITMYDRAVFAGGVSLSGYYFAREDPTTGNLWGGSLARQHRNDLEWTLAHRPAPPVSLMVTTARTETRFDGYPDALKFLHLVKPPMRVTALIEPTGGHNFATWDAELPRALHWLSARITARP
ncbi:MAG TPA: alpha/beta hydrolase-fold protein [Segeticoccus sp.]|uniref:alpha/beta hydrolase n=1 Tax=Segeticoccus sp. TaxID=2706531 RepID=UPI002D7EEC87|nr:alpha/beta hydrolase-fold protein [Segeticoccus sp.]HET8602276.1 alpha/beta hydrolase-fold protein [Segeticoccus sp.]